jgi:methylmalonyl-CoA mutase
MPVEETRNQLFQDFPPVTISQWRSQIEKDLKGIPFERLIWRSEEGFDVLPFYMKDDPAGKIISGSSPYESWLIVNDKNSNDWIIRQDISFETVEEANAKAIHAIERGADSLGFIIPENLVLTQNTFSGLLKNIPLDRTDINFSGHAGPFRIFKFLDIEIRNKGIDPSLVKGSIDHDPLGYLSTHGHFNLSEKDDLNLCSDLVRKSSSLPNIRILGINAQIFHNSGATAVQDLGLGLAMVSEYMDQLTQSGLMPDQIAGVLQFNFATGSSFFMEIAKIRAARLLYSQLIDSWGVKEKKLLNPLIHCNTSEWSQTIFDPYMNMLRSTTQLMSAVIGGANSVTVIPYDYAFKKPSLFSERIARNAQVILKEEAYFDKVIDPSAGSWYIENLTHSITKHAWDLFLQVEDQGGYLEAFKAGFIQKLIHEASENKDRNLALSKKILIGVNKYIDPLEKNPEADGKYPATTSGKTDRAVIAQPLVQYRAARIFEEIRRRTGKSNAGIPKVFLLTFGKPGPRRARAEFASNFFSIAGFDILDHYGFESIPAGIESANSAEPDILVLCSSDEEYLQIPPDLNKILKGKMIPVIAGYPIEILEDIKSKGIHHFIHMKSNLPEELTKYQDLLDL